MLESGTFYFALTRNRAALLRRCLESLEKSQGRETLQVIVVDNGSSDGSAQLDTDFPQAQFIRLPKNFGPTKAMNLGWRAAEPSGSQPEPVEYPRGAALMMRVYVILLDPAARVRHRGSAAYSALERADFLLGRAVFMGKYLGFGAGLRARMAAVIGPLFSFRFGEFRYTVAGQKIDGTQL